jgi:hypothetical protein
MAGRAVSHSSGGVSGKINRRRMDRGGGRMPVSQGLNFVDGSDALAFSSAVAVPEAAGVAKVSAVGSSGICTRYFRMTLSGYRCWAAWSQSSA